MVSLSFQLPVGGKVSRSDNFLPVLLILAWLVLIAVESLFLVCFGGNS
jgi:hypothetical protein